MNHKLKVCLGAPKNDESLVYVRKVSVRERVLRLLLGGLCKVTIIVPGKSVSQLFIEEEANEKQSSH